MSSDRPDDASPGARKPAEKLFVCHLCHRAFTTFHGVKKHLLIHSGEKRFACNLCQKRFTEKGCLNKHLRTHTGEKPYVCNTCQRAFTQVSHLKTHTRLHTGERPYTCAFCQRTFIRITELKIHLRVHTKEKPFVCDLCQQEFQHKRGLDYHLMKHTGEKPFPCDQCAKRFTRKRTLILHTRTIHDGLGTRPGKTPRDGPRTRSDKSRRGSGTRYRTICPAPPKVATLPDAPLGNPSPRGTTHEVRPRQRIRRWRSILPAVQSSNSPATFPILVLFSPQLPQQQVTIPSG